MSPQASNLDMQQEMALRENGFNETLGEMLRPRDIVKRINKLRGNVARGENPVLKEDDDEVDGALKNLLELLNQVVGMKYGLVNIVHKQDCLLF